MLVSVHVRMCTCIYASVAVMYVCVCTHVYVYVRMCAGMYAGVRVLVHGYVYVRMLTYT